MTTLTLSQLLKCNNEQGEVYFGPGSFLFHQRTPSTFWIVTHNLGTKYPVTELIFPNDKVVNGRYDYPEITFIDENILTVSWDYSTAGYIACYGGTANASAQSNVTISSGNIVVVNQSGYIHNQNSSSALWVVNHNLNQKYVDVQIVDSNDNVLDGRYDFPQIHYVDNNSLTITFTYSLTGKAIITTAVTTGNIVGNIVATLPFAPGIYGDSNVRALLSGNTISTIGTQDMWVTGNIHFGPTGEAGRIQTHTGVDLFASAGSDWAQLNYNNQVYVAALTNGVEIDVGAKTWTMDTSGTFAIPGNIRFPDGTLQNTAISSAVNNPVTSTQARKLWVSNVAPTGADGNIGDIWYKY